MIKLAIVAGNATHKLADSLDKKEFYVEKKYEKIDELWDEIFESGNSSFVDIDKIIILQNGFLSPNEIPYAEQVLNLQSVMAMNNLRSTLYFVIKDTELYQEVSEQQDDFVIYRNFNMLIFKEINIRVFGDVVKGKYDAEGIFHPDFLRRNEIDEQLNKQNEEVDIEEEAEETEEVETFDDFADSKEKQRELKKKELEERRRKAIEEREKAKQEKLNKKKAENLLKNNKPKSKPVPKKPAKSPKQKRRPVLDLYRGVIAVTGTRQSGVSTTAANIAEVYASNGNTVLLIDLDIKRRFQTYIYPEFKEAIKMDSRIAHSLLVSLINPKNLEEVAAVVSNNVALLSISQDVERDIKKFANRPFDKVFSGADMVNLLSFAKSMFDVVILDMPFEAVKQVGECLSYVDKVVACVPNTEYHLDQFIEVEIEDLLNQSELSANTLLSKSKLLLTRYHSHSKMLGKEMSPNLVMDLLGSLEESIFHLEVIGKVPFTLDYEKQFEKGKLIVNTDNDYKIIFEDFLSLL